MIHTELCDLLNIKYPVIQGGMAWIADAELAAAVSNAGGLGLISAMNANADWLRGEIQKIRTLTDKPYGVNLMLQSPFVDQVAELVLEEKVPVLTTGAGNPGKYMAKWIDAGIKVLPVVASASFARMVQRSGATAVIAEGCESGGHIGELTTMALLPQVCDVVDIPVVAAGGIYDGRGLAAALMLGACGVQMGTRFLTAFECSVHENYKQKVLKARDIDTIITGKRLGHPVRSLKSPFSREYAKQEYSATITDEELEMLGGGVLYSAAKEGDEKKGCFIAGQVAGMVNKEESAADIVLDVCNGAERVLKEAAKCLG